MKSVRYPVVVVVTIFLSLVFAGVSCDKEDELPAEENGGQTENPDPGPPGDFVKESHHPFLIVRKEQFDFLRERANDEPWRSLKADALLRSARGSTTSAYPLQEYIGAAALSYILDERYSEMHAHRVRDAILKQYSQLRVEDGGGWGGVVPPMGSFFMAILALDIVYNSLTAEEIWACEQVISEQIFKINRRGAWEDVRLGTHGTWDIYKGERTTPDDNYYNGVMIQITEDGVSPVTNHYAWDRLGGGNSRLSKSGYMDVLEFTGVDRRYYNNERIQKFYRWLFGSSLNCSKEMAIFGDMLPTQTIQNDMLHRRVGNFCQEAAGYAAWYHEGVDAMGNILTFILPKEAFPEPVVPRSRIYTNGGAFFREKDDDPDGLHGVLYNIMSQDEWHTHNEVNGLALSGLGNRLMVNGGRLGAPTRPAPLNNTLTINEVDHVARVGGGITEGFTSGRFDYASGYSGGAISNGKHYRNLILVHASQGSFPYFILIDEVETSPGNSINNYLHPANESRVTTVRQNEVYDARIDHYPTVLGSSLMFFYATPPENIEIMKVPGAIPERYPDYPDHNRLESVYKAGECGNRNMVTVLFPHRDDYSAFGFRRLEGEGFTGGAVEHGSTTTDFIVESTGNERISAGNSLFNGLSAVWREIGEENDFFFVRRGTSFRNGLAGFESDRPVSMYMDDNEGVIVSDGATIRLIKPGAGRIHFHNHVAILEQGDDFVEVEAGAGEIRFSL